MSNIKEVNINDVDLNNAYFHFTNISNLESIAGEGLKAQIGEASKMVGDSARVYMSEGGKGILGIINSFIYEFQNLRICDIPVGFRKYFRIKDYSSIEKVKLTDVYSAIERKLKDEVYLMLDVKEGEDFFKEDNHGLGSNYDIKGKENHNIDAEKISILFSKKGNSAFDIVKYIYEKLIENAKKVGKDDVVRDWLNCLNGMFEYIEQRDNQDIGLS